MRMHQEALEVRTEPRALVDLTDRVAEVIRRSGVRTGLCTVFVTHTSASLVIQENADPAVLRDLARFIEGLAPESRAWEHVDEGPDDMPAHARAAVLRTNETIPIADGELTFGVWQALYLWEHRAAPRTRKVVVHITGE
jgi:secondary thiamine-phosphate synthase enzyme